MGWNITGHDEMWRDMHDQIQSSLPYVKCDKSYLVEIDPSLDTQGWFRSLHQPLGQLAEFPSLYRWMNIIILLVSSSFSGEQDDQWKRSLQESGYLIGPHAIMLRIDFRWQIQSFSS